MTPDQFKLNNFAPAAKYRDSLKIDDSISLPLLIARGRSAGKTLVVTANIHGDEYEGVRAIFESFDSLDPDQMSGNLVAVPVANPPAFWGGKRSSPVDGKNLARTFPGSQDGTISEKIAFALGYSVISLADFYIDLHSGGVVSSMPSMAGYFTADRRSYEGAVAFGASVIWGHDTVAPGRTVSFATSAGISCIYTEARGAGRIHPEDLDMMKTGIRNLLVYLQILPGSLEPREIPWRLRGDGNTDEGIIASQAGFLLTKVSLLQEVKQGDILGSLVNMHGEVLEDYHAPQDGVIGLVREFPVVAPGDSLFLLTRREI
ncbi:MAG: succinylglutamate desuccinylase/aspartoacylase family protein [Acidobacteria bacterium]|nr:succinylglutamate desuccinylase/aspartoacylase family protein [Acidobacteriota bacterium]